MPTVRNSTNQISPADADRLYVVDMSSPVGTGDGYLTIADIKALTPAASNSNTGKIALAGDLGGTAASPQVVGLRGRAIDSTAPTDGQVIYWDQTSSSYKHLTTNLTGTTKVAFDVGDGVNLEPTVTHNLGTRDVSVTIRRNTVPYDIVDVKVEVTDPNYVTLKPGFIMGLTEFRAVVIG